MVEFEGKGTPKTIFFKKCDRGGFIVNKELGKTALFMVLDVAGICWNWVLGREGPADLVMRAPKSRGKLIRKKPPMTP